MFTLGFDVAKDHVDIALVNSSGQCKERWQVTNTAAAILQLLKEIQTKHSKLQVGCESTGYYHLMVVQAATEADIGCYVLNPIMTKQFAKSTVRGRKTDQDDAVNIARLVLRGEGSLVHCSKRALPKTLMRLATKVTQQRQSLRLQGRFYQEFHQAIGVVIDEADSPFSDSLAELSALIERLRADATQLIDTEQVKLLQSITGIGSMVAVTVAAEVGDIAAFAGPKKLVAFAGLDPKVKQKSGTKENLTTHLTKRGSPELRRVLFLAAGVARQYDNELYDIYEARRRRGKSYTESTITVAQKLCYRIYAVLTRGTAYEKHGISKKST